ncbi:hypothetical protein [Aliikangiella sp. IMCC44359]|uniref:Dph6-related ATP pyrophosphatase n=1 Tax=Aliikangiella sp. IMCC44359 TaxID=3459125 RepID=UPI00403B2912
MAKKRVVVSWSSGKDSALTLIKLMNNPIYQVVGLFTTYYQNYVPYQATPLPILKMQAERVGLPLITQQLPQIFPTNAIYQQLVVDALLKSEIVFDAIAFGDMFCNGIADYRRSYIEPEGWQCLFPLMGLNTKNIAHEIIEQQVKAFICSVDTAQLDKKYLGCEYSLELLNRLPLEIDPCGENGEFHTFVYNMPCFSTPLEVRFIEQKCKEELQYQSYHIIH